MKTPRAEFMHSAGGSLWWDGNSVHSKILDSSLSTVPASVAFAGGLWFGAFNENNDLFARGETYELSSNFQQSDYAPGPISNGNNQAEFCELFNRVWEVKGTEIVEFNNDWADGQLDNTISENIKLWPGKGNKNVENDWGISLPFQDLAPFYDKNNNGTYEPELGDHPDIRNAEIAQWWMFHDGGPGLDNYDPGKIEVSVLAYSFDTEQAGNTTFFYEYNLQNKSGSEEFHDAYIGLWLDGDLGCYTDDYFGCYPAKHLAYVYNEDAIDGQNGTSCPNEVQSFDVATPLFGVKILDGTDKLDENLIPVDNGMSSFSYYYGYNSGTTGPTNQSEYYNFLTGRWRDGTPITVGGQGYNPASTETTNFAFPDLPDDPAGWSMCTTGLGQADRRVVIGSGPFPLAPGESQKFSFAAIVTGAIEDYPCPSIDPLVEAADAAQEVYDNLISSTQAPSHGFDMTVFPNPFTEQLSITTGEVELVEIQLFNSQGQIMQQQKNEGKNVIELTIATQLPAGCYWLRVLDKNGNQGFKKIIKI